MRSHSSNQEGPLGYWGRIPIYVTTLIVLIHVALMVLVAILGIMHPLWDQIVFHAFEVVRLGKLWKIVTYALFTPPEVWVGIGLVMFFLYGGQVEGFLGRQSFLKLYFTLLFAQPLFLVLLYLCQAPVGGYRLETSRTIQICIFLAFAFVYPNGSFFFGFLAKWVAAFFVAIYSLNFLAHRDWIGLAVLWFSVLVTYCTLRMLGLTPRFPAIEDKFQKAPWKRKSRNYRDSKKRLSVVTTAVARSPSPAKGRTAYQPKLAPRAEVPKSDPDVASIDHLLDKIASSGLASLTEEERRQLESASASLAEKDRKS